MIIDNKLMLFDDRKKMNPKKWWSREITSSRVNISKKWDIYESIVIHHLWLSCLLCRKTNLFEIKEDRENAIRLKVLKDILHLQREINATNI